MFGSGRGQQKRIADNRGHNRMNHRFGLHAAEGIQKVGMNGVAASAHIGGEIGACVDEARGKARADAWET